MHPARSSCSGLSAITTSLGLFLRNNLKSSPFSGCSNFDLSITDSIRLFGSNFSFSRENSTYSKVSTIFLSTFYKKRIILARNFFLLPRLFPIFSKIIFLNMRESHLKCKKKTYLQILRNAVLALRLQIMFRYKIISVNFAPSARRVFKRPIHVL